MNLFTPEDFEELLIDDVSVCDRAAEIANAKLKQWLTRKEETTKDNEAAHESDT